jgi:uncharacterized protein
MASFLSPCARNPGATFRLRTEAGTVVASRLEVALDRAARNRGLLGRDGLEAGGGMVIAPTNSVHTFFMRFPIDIVFVRRDGTVVKVRPSVRPWRLAASLSAYAVVELPAGTAAALGVERGARLAVEAV